MRFDSKRRSTANLWADAPIPATTLDLFLELLRATHGGNVLRMKGIVQLKVEHGEGFDADTYKVNARDITSVGDAATEQDDDDLGVEEADAPASEEVLDESDPLDGAE